jgi:pyruvate carboxylase
MYPDVFLKFADFRKTYGDVAALPTPAYYYGLQQTRRRSTSSWKPARPSSSASST